MSGHTSDVVLQSQFIRAGAGAGKTTTLIRTFLDFVRAFEAMHGRYPRVVMTTFTRKATQEVKERLLVSALSAGEKEIFEYINKKSSVHISTIHGLLSLYLSQYSERMKFPQEIRIVDGMQYQRVLKRQINEILKKNAEYLELLEQYSFTQLTELASDALDFYFQHREISYVSERELRAVADQKKAAILADIRQILALVPQEPEKWQTYFSALKNAALLLQEKREAEFLELIENFPQKPVWSNAKPPFDPSAHNLIVELKDGKFKKLFGSSEYILRHESLNALFFSFLDRLAEVMLTHKRSTGELTISDLENLSLQLLEEHPETAAEFSESWDYFMIDEYQDTSPLQVDILNRIVRHKPCFIVGDPQQSIYLFRGARSEVFEEKLTEMKAKNARIQTLETNYRSEPGLMTFMNDFFSHFSPQFKPMLTKDKKNEAKKLAHDAYFIKSPDQTGAVLQHIQFLLAQGVPAQDICVLSRSNGKLNEISVKANRIGIPVQLQAAAGFEEKREVLDLLAFNRFLNNPHDNENLVMLLRSPWFYVADPDILALAQSELAKQQSIWSALLASEHPQRDILQGYCDLFDQQGALRATQSFIREQSFLILSEAYDHTGKREANIFKYLSALAQAEKAAGFSLGLFLDEQFQSLQSDLGSSAGEAQPVEQPNCVSLMTVHASKGLQFPHVIVIGFADTPQLSRTPKITFDDESRKFSLAVLDDETSKHIPSDWAQQVIERFKERELLENERVLYVAMTRAIESLSLVAETERKITSDKSWLKKSRWPLDEEEANEHYRIRSLQYDGSLSGTEKTKQSRVAVRGLFSDHTAGEAGSGSVTELISAPAVKGTDVNFEMALINLKKAQKGSDLHRVFEAMKYMDHTELAQRLPASDRGSIEYLLNLKELNIRELLKHGHGEWGFGVRGHERFLQGQIDLWADLPEAVHVLDFKTGSPRYEEKAFDQLSVYTLALLQMKIISAEKKIIHSVVYPVEQTTRMRSYENAADLCRRIKPEIRGLFLAPDSEPGVS